MATSAVAVAAAATAIWAFDLKKINRPYSFNRPCNYTCAYDYDWPITLAGEKAAMVLDGRGYRVYKEVHPSGTP
jgi:hypothetical protein